MAPGVGGSRRVVLAFGDFELDLARRELRREGAPSNVRRKPLEVLVYLARQRGRTIPKEELLREVWPGGGVSEMALDSALRDLRRALGDLEREQRWIRTLRGRGIRFEAPVEEHRRKPAPAASTLIGRTDALAGLERSLDAAGEGRHGVALLTGEAGIGKTRLARELAERAAARGIRCAWGRCWDAEGAPPFFPWTTVLRAVLADTSAGRLRERLGERTPWLAPLVPELVDEVPASEGGGRFLVFAAVGALLRSLAEAGPLIVVLDDVQEADLSSLELLRYLAFEELPAPLLLVATWRDGEPGENDPRMRVLASLARGERVESLPLTGLDTSDTAALVARLAGHEPDAGFLAALHEQTAGNPFFVGETVRALLASLPPEERSHRWTASASLETAGVADGIRRMVVQRLEVPGAECRPVLDAASVIGGEVALDLLEEVGSLRSHPVPALLDKARVSHLIEEAPGRRGRLHFSHPLVREVLYQALDLERRRVLHREVGEALERRSRGEAERPWAALAHHFHEAGPATLEKAVTYSTRAGHAATERYAWEDAADHFARGLELQSRTGTHDPKARCELLIALSRVQRLALRLRDALETGIRAVDLARDLDEPVLFATAAVHLGTARSVEGATDPAEILSLLEEALERLGEADLSLRALLLGEIARVGAAAGADVEAVGLEAVALGRRARPVAFSYSLSGCWLAHWRPPHLGFRAGLVEEMLKVGARDPDFFTMACQMKFSDCIRKGDLAGAEAALQGAAGSLPGPNQKTNLLLRHGQLDLLQGRMGEAETTALEALRAGRAAGSTALANDALTLLGAIRWLQGRLGELLPAVEAEPTLSGNEEAIALIGLAAGHEDRAREAFGRFAARDFEPPVETSGEPDRLAFLAELCHRLGAAGHVPALERRLAPYLPQHLLGGAYGGSSLHLMGVLAATAGRHDEGLDSYERAVAAYEDLNAVPWIAKLRWVQAKSLEARGAPGDAERAGKLRAEAQATAERLGIRL